MQMRLSSFKFSLEVIQEISKGICLWRSGSVTQSLFIFIVRWQSSVAWLGLWPWTPQPPLIHHPHWCIIFFLWQIFARHGQTSWFKMCDSNYATKSHTAILNIHILITTISFQIRQIGFFFGRLESCFTQSLCGTQENKPFFCNRQTQDKHIKHQQIKIKKNYKRLNKTKLPFDAQSF